jgi:hypothetical protein
MSSGAIGEVKEISFWASVPNIGDHLHASCAFGAFGAAALAKIDALCHPRAGISMDVML